MNFTKALAKDDKRKPGKGRIKFLRGFFKNPVMVGSVIPSSRILIDKMLAPVDWETCRLFVEYGPGVGTFTHEILSRLHPDARLIDASGAVRAAERGVEGLTRIPATPSSAALPRLLAVLQQGGSFCVSDSALPDGTQAATGDFLTLTGGSSGQPEIKHDLTIISWDASETCDASRTASRLDISTSS